MKSKPYCDHGHYAVSVRRLPTNGSAGVIVCKKHYQEEIDFRLQRNIEHNDMYDIPTWASLKNYID